MVSARKNLTLDKGATFKQSFRYRDSNNEPVDLTGWSATFNIMVRGLGNNIVKSVECTVDDQGFIISFISDEDTELLTPVLRAYALDLEDPLGNIDRILFGQLAIREASDV